MEILALDDEVLSLQRLEKAIHEAAPNDPVHAFMRAEDALDYVGRNNIDVVFLDVQLGCSSGGIELARELKAACPNINIVFATGYSEYMGQAFALHASGYITKPVTAEKVLSELNNLRNPVSMTSQSRLSVQCFGNFDVFYDGVPVAFHYTKSKELFAYLVDRKGASATGSEVCAVLWEENSNSKATKAYLRTIFNDLKNTFTELGVEDVLVKGWNSYAVKRDAFWCDYYEFDKGNPNAINSFHNEYMSQYSWAELRLGEFRW